MSSFQKIIHFRYSRIISSNERIDFSYKGNNYSLSFNSEEFNHQYGIIITSQTRFIDTELLLWLSVYFGEDFIEPNQEKDTRFAFNRGDFIINEEFLFRFIKKIEKTPPKTYPKWKKQLFDNAITYFSVAIRSGIDLMPLTLGFFGMTLECIGNIRYGKRDKHFTLGDKKFLELIRTRLKRYKLNINHKESTKKFESFVIKDVELINIIRNAYYGHSLLHLQSDKLKLTKALKEWYLRSGHSKKFTDSSIKSSRIDQIITSEGHALYKVGLRTSRIFIFMLLGFSRSIQWASHDFQIIGNLKKDEQLEHKSMKITLRTT